MCKCKKCDKEFEPSKGLINYCSLKCRSGKTWNDEDKKKKSDSAKNSSKVKEANKIIANNNKGEKVERLKTVCPVCNKIIISLPSLARQYHKECWLKASGGYREGSSRGKSGWYKNYWCDSSWELAWVVYHLDHNIKFTRNKQAFDYFFDGKNSKYYPDFILDDGTYIEVKNYDSQRLEAKLKCFPHHIKVLFKADLKGIFEYVEERYGKDFTSLYDS